MEETIRQVEKEVDDLFLSHDLMCLPFAAACQYLLIAFEYQNWASMFSGQPETFFEHLALIQKPKQGLTHAMNWLSTKTDMRQGLVEKIHDGALKGAADFLDMAESYHAAVTGYTMWSRGWATAELLDEFSVKFRHDAEEVRYDVLDVMLYVDNTKNQLGKAFKKHTDAFKKAIGTINSTVTTDTKYTISYTTNGIDWAGMLPYGIEMVRGQLLPPDRWNFSDLTTDDLVSFWAALCLVAMFNFVALHHAITELSLKKLPLANTIMVRTRNNWAKLLSRSSGLSKEAVFKCIDYHTYCSHHRKPDIVLTPFVRITENNLALAPTLITTSNLPRNLLKHLAKNYKEEFDKNSEVFADEMVEDLEKLVNTGQFKIVTKKKIPDQHGLPDIDACLIDEINCEMMVCELKWTLPPADPSEIVDKMEIEKNALRQIKLLHAYFTENEQAVASVMGLTQAIPKERMFFIIVVRDFVGTARNFNSAYPQVHYQIFDQLLREGLTLSKIKERISKRVFLPKEGIDYKTIEEKHVIGKYNIYWTGWTK